MTDLVIRAALQDDLEILWDFLAIAAYEPDATAAKTLPNVAAYLAGWRRPGDFGFVAEQDGAVIGAAWARQFSADDHKIAFAGDRTPWISIGVRPAARGQGIGEKLLRALIAEAGLRELGLCLSVRSENPARRLYDRLGFRVGAGHEVVGLDILPSPFTPCVGSVTERGEIRRRLRGVEQVYHTATLHRPHVDSHGRQDFVDINVTGTLNLLEERPRRAIIAKGRAAAALR